jgi:hypothetical protein
MLLAVCVLLCPDSTSSYSGRDHELDVPIPRLEAEVVIDGDLADSVWARAARLTGFSQYSPNDGVPAADSTQVLVWYSASAIYFGIRAFEAHGRPTVTLASRDQIFGDDNVQILLGTFHDGKQALMFAVNPLGVQGDGSLVEGANVTASGFIGSAVVGHGRPRGLSVPRPQADGRRLLPQAELLVQAVSLSAAGDCRRGAAAASSSCAPTRLRRAAIAASAPNSPMRPPLW